VKSEEFEVQVLGEVGDFGVNVTKTHGDMRSQLIVAQDAEVRHLEPADLADLVRP
jgi:hypothetical protein